jgi:uncharacterized protein YegL
MKKQLTDIIFLIDNSGSMAGMEKDTLGGFNSFIKLQKQEENPIKVTTILFNSEYKYLHNRVDINEIKNLTERDYKVGGMTALNDTIGVTINKFEEDLRVIKSKFRPDNVMVVIITDGLENSSREYTTKDVKNLISKKTEEDWKFIYLGANVDSFSESAKIGINLYSNYSKDSIGTASIYQTMSKCASNVARGQSVSMDDLNEII